MKILKVEYNNYKINGCETCDYGSNYINMFSIYTNRDKISYELYNEYEYLLTESDLIKIIGNANCEDDIEEKIKDIITSNKYKAYNGEFIIIKNNKIKKYKFKEGNLEEEKDYDK